MGAVIVTPHYSVQKSFKAAEGEAFNRMWIEIGLWYLCLFAIQGFLCLSQSSTEIKVLVGNVMVEEIKKESGFLWIYMY